MMFDKFCIEKILNGEKCVTRRLVKNNRRPAVPGHIHKLKINRTSETFGKILINSCTKEKLTDITDADAVKEGFTNKYDYFKYFMKINKIDSIDCEVWRVRFTVIEKSEPQ